MPTIQYTIRNIPSAVDRVLRKRATQLGKSFNQTVVDLLTQQTLGSTNPTPDPEFTWLFNHGASDAGFDSAINELSQVDEPLWQ